MMTSNGGPVISVIIPAYNAEATLGQQLSALVAQDVTAKYEVLVADNGSTDGTPSLVRRYSAEYPFVRLIDAAAKPGAGAARNVGVSQARSDFFAFCDADDVVDVHWIGALLQASNSACHLAGAVDERTLGHGAPLRDLTLAPPAMYGEPYALGCNVAVSREAFEGVGGFSESAELRSGQDADLSYRLTEAGHELAFVPEALVYKRPRKASVWAAYHQALWWGRGRAALRSRHPELLGEAPMSPAGDEPVLRRLVHILSTPPLLRTLVRPTTVASLSGSLIGERLGAPTDANARLLGGRTTLRGKLARPMSAPQAGAAPAPHPPTAPAAASGVARVGWRERRGSTSGPNEGRHQADAPAFLAQLGGLATASMQADLFDTVVIELDDKWQSDLALLTDGGMASVAYHLLSLSQPAPSDELLRTVHALSLWEQAATLRAVWTAVPALEALAAANFEFVVIKGPALGSLPGDRGFPRTFKDVDIVVPSHDMAPVAKFLARLGYEPPNRARRQRPWIDTICREGVNLHSPSGGNIDVHHHIPPFFLGRHLSFTELLARSSEMDLGNLKVRAASTSDSLIIAALHILNDLWMGRPSLRTWRDLAQLGAMLGLPACDETFARQQLGDYWDHLRGVVFAAGRPAAAESRHERTTRSLAQTVLETRLALLGWYGASTVTRHPASWVARLSVPRAAAFALATAVPSSTYIRANFGTYAAYWAAISRTTRLSLHGQDVRVTPNPPEV